LKADIPKLGIQEYILNRLEKAKLHGSWNFIHGGDFPALNHRLRLRQKFIRNGDFVALNIWLRLIDPEKCRILVLTLTFLNRRVAERSKGDVFFDEGGASCGMLEEIRKEEDIYKGSVINAPAGHAYQRIEATTFNLMAATRSQELNRYPPNQLPSRNSRFFIKVTPWILKPGIQGFTLQKSGRRQTQFSISLIPKKMLVINSLTCKIQIRELRGNCWENYYLQSPSEPKTKFQAQSVWPTRECPVEHETTTKICGDPGFWKAQDLQSVISLKR
jgi:hypothetical protein